MTTAGDAERKIGAIMVGGRGYLSSKNKPITGINRGMFLQTVVRFIILDSPVGFKIPGEFKRVPLFIQLTRRGFSFLFFFFQLLFAHGMTDRLNQACVNGDAFVNG